jgi:hypothetical protein
MVLANVLGAYRAKARNLKILRSIKANRETVKAINTSLYFQIQISKAANLPKRHNLLANKRSSYAVVYWQKNYENPIGEKPSNA